MVLLPWLLMATCALAAASPPPYGGDFLNIHIVAHTHDDTGYLMTTDEYYIEIIQFIFDTMVPSLTSNKERKFSYVEMAYFQRWWSEIDDNLKNQTLALLRSKQLEINLGGWCMNDEGTAGTLQHLTRHLRTHVTANPDFLSEIRNMMDGAQFVVDAFGAEFNAKSVEHLRKPVQQCSSSRANALPVNEHSRRRAVVLFSHFVVQSDQLVVLEVVTVSVG